LFKKIICLRLVPNIFVNLELGCIKDSLLLNVNLSFGVENQDLRVANFKPFKVRVYKLLQH
jgi:hypothetical protein